MISIKGLRIELPKPNVDPLALGRAVENAGEKFKSPPMRLRRQFRKMNSGLTQRSMA